MKGSSLVVTQSDVEATPVARLPLPETHPVLRHALKAQTLQGNLVARAMGNAVATAEVFAFGIDQESYEELSRMGEAVWSRLRILREGWVRDWQNWFLYADKINGANTMSKLVEREGNIAAQFAQIVGEQVTGMVGLQENILVDYSYWINEKLNEKRRSAIVPD
jgi:hypothetical protein